MDADRTTTILENVMSTAGRPETLQGCLAELGISLTDAKGALRSAYDIIEDMAMVWKEQIGSAKLIDKLVDAGTVYPVTYEELKRALNGVENATKSEAP